MARLISFLWLLVVMAGGVGRRAQPGADVELYRQACEDAPAYMDLRFRHFGTFVLVTFKIATVGIKTSALSPSGVQLCAVGAVVSSGASMYERLAT
jgi:hypothetical protein